MDQIVAIALMVLAVGLVVGGGDALRFTAGAPEVMCKGVDKALTANDDALSVQQYLGA